jgi:hypothetical protein
MRTQESTTYFSPKKVYLWVLLREKVWIIPMVLAVFFAFALIHVKRIGLGPNGYHKWRESDTAMVAENFSTNKMKFLYPSVNLIGEAGDGVVGMELPIYNFIVAQAYQSLGFNHLWPRLLSLSAGVFGVLGVWLLTSLITNDPKVASLASWTFAWSPLIYFYSYKIQPDIFGYSLSIWGIGLFIMWRRGLQPFYGVVSAACLAIAGGIKPTFLAVGLPMLVIYAQEADPWRIWKKPGLLLYGLTVLFVPLVWILHAKVLTAKFGEPYFYLGEQPLRELRGLLRPEFYQNVLLTWPIELALGIPSFASFLFAVCHRQVRAKIPLVIVPWILGGAFVLVLAAEHCATPHDYYFLVVLLPLSLIAAFGYSEMLSRGRWRYVAIVLLFSLPLFAVKRMEGRFSTAPNIITIRQKINEYFAHDLLDKSEPISENKPLALAVDHIPGFLLYVTGLRGFHMMPDGDISYFQRYRSQGARWVITRKDVFASTEWLAPFVKKQIVFDSDVILLELKEI